MGALSRTINNLLNRFDLHLSRASGFKALQYELERRQQQIDDMTAVIQTEKNRLEQARLFDLSKTRWRADEPDVALTWGVHMEGDVFVRFLASHVSLTDTSTIVEIGPGYGRILSSIIERRIPFGRYIGLDISAARVLRLRDQFQDPRIEFREADVLHPVELNAVADLTFSSAVFEHLYPDFTVAMKNISAFMRPGGPVIVDFIRDDEYPDKMASWFEDNDTYIRVYSIQELRTLFSGIGFNVNDMASISFGQDATGREITRTIVALLVAQR